MNKKLAIVGAEPRTRDLAPWGDETFDIWGISAWASKDWMRRCNAVIEIHKPSVYENNNADNQNYAEWLRDANIPIYMQNASADIPKSEAYPLAAIRDKFLYHFFVEDESARAINSSISYAIALALYQGYEQIDIYGVEMSNSSEYRAQQPIFAFWLGIAIGLGISINLHCTERLFLQPFYGYEDAGTNGKIHDYINGMTVQYEEFKSQSLKIEGALQFARQLLQEEG